MINTDLLLGGAAGIVLHEAGHAAAAVLQGLKVRKVGISWKGAYVIRQAGTPLQNAVVALAGPVVNLILACVLPTDMALANIILAAVNLLPFKGSDGRAIFRPNSV